jgi:hypothetical protein
MRGTIYVGVLAGIMAILAVSSSFSDRRSVKTWAPNALGTSKTVETAAVVKPNMEIKRAAPDPAPADQGPSPKQLSTPEPPATRATTTTIDTDTTGTLLDTDTTGTLPDRSAIPMQMVAPQVSPAPSHALDSSRRSRAAYPARARPRSYANRTRSYVNRTRTAAAQYAQTPIQFRLAEGRN